ncbi:opacity protein-like surface antigen [Natronocella acetinitrilica]|uniref:Opacity protein-like surface antigen n=1 Tax=Natronocella acetinitrilica TaxID=414046 RepID=A0AAE3G9C9_9GAMM|nr:outer membrane beta-barrel protein [Natronocella acetinitrilica]MCP1676873.1 opacity protein-like surface antigen [Natronocella acetinitrilica]
MDRRLLVPTAALIGGLLVAGNAQANENLTGVYATVSGGYSVMDIDIRDGGAFGDARLDGAGASGASLSGAIGTSLVMGRFYGAIEVYAGASTADFEYRVGGDRLKLEAEDFFGIALRAGSEVRSNMVLYGILGYQSTKFEETVTIAGNTSSGSDRFDGVRGGLGLELASEDRVFARFEYSIIRYGSETYGSGADAVRYQPTESLFSVSAGYRF